MFNANETTMSYAYVKKNVLIIAFVRRTLELTREMQRATLRVQLSVPPTFEDQLTMRVVKRLSYVCFSIQYFVLIAHEYC